MIKINCKKIIIIIYGTYTQAREEGVAKAK